MLEQTKKLRCRNWRKGAELAVQRKVIMKMRFAIQRYSRWRKLLRRWMSGSLICMNQIINEVSVHICGNRYGQYFKLYDVVVK